MGHGEGKADTGVEGSQRVYSPTVTSLLRLAAHVHFCDCECDGSLSTDGVEGERADSMKFFLVCLKCGADFGNVPIGGTCRTSTTLGVLMSGSTFDHWMGSHEFSNSLSFSSSSMLKSQKACLAVICRVYDETMKAVRDDYKERCDKKILVPVEDVYLLKHKKKLEEMLASKQLGAQVSGLAVARASHTEKELTYR